MAAFQAARFAKHCRVFAPLYRQITLAGLRRLGTTTAATAARHAELVRSIRELTNEAERARRRLAEGEQLEAGSAVREELLSAKARAERSISRMRQENLALQQQIGTAETRASELAAREQVNSPRPARR